MLTRDPVQVLMSSLSLEKGKSKINREIKGPVIKKILTVSALNEAMDLVWKHDENDLC